METPYVYPNLGHENIKQEASAPFSQIIHSRLKEFLSELNKLIDLLKHYKKVKKQWTMADSVIKIVGITIGGISGIATIILTPLVGIPYIAIITGTFSALDLFTTKALSICLTAKRKKSL